MFTGIITNTGKVSRKTDEALSIAAGKSFLKCFRAGESVSVDGVCLTVAEKSAQGFTAAVMPETFLRTNLGRLKKNSTVNLELPATPSSFLSGHIVQGHIDGVAKLLRVTQKGNSRILAFSAPLSLTTYIVEKGSVAVDGISFTVISAKKSGFVIGVIPHTWDTTTLHALKIGDFVNIEIDILAKYAGKFSKKLRT